MSPKMHGSGDTGSRNATTYLTGGIYSPFVAASTSARLAARSVSQSVRTRSHSWIMTPYDSKKTRIRRRFHPAMSSRIGTRTARALVLRKRNQLR